MRMTKKDSFQEI